MGMWPDGGEENTEFNDDLHHVLRRFVEDIGRVAAKHGVENMVGVYSIAFMFVLEHSVTEEEHIVEFAEAFMDTVKRAKKDGFLEARLDEEHAKEQRDEAKRIREAKDRARKREGRGRGGAAG